MLFERKDLTAACYIWQNDQHLYEGLPSRRIFDKDNGNQVLFLINHYASFDNTFARSQLQLIEDLLRAELPLEAKSEITVFKWMMQQGIKVRKAMH